MVRGGDDWSGRSGKCPNCGAEIFFPRVGPEPARPKRDKPVAFIDPDKYLNVSGWSAIAIVAIGGLAAWFWLQLIVILAFGIAPYRLGLRVSILGKLPGLSLNNGQELGMLWYIVGISGFTWTFAGLVRGANYLVERHRPRGMAIAAVVLLGVPAWIDLIRHAIAELHPLRAHFAESASGRALVSLVVIFIAGGTVLWRDLKAEKTGKNAIEMPYWDEAP
jgi:hypothetical protein